MINRELFNKQRNSLKKYGIDLSDYFMGYDLKSQDERYILAIRKSNGLSKINESFIINHINIFEEIYLTQKSKVIGFEESFVSNYKEHYTSIPLLIPLIEYTINLWKQEKSWSILFAHIQGQQNK